MYDIETTDMLLAVNDHTGPAHVTTTGDYYNVASIELDEICNLVLLDIKLDGVVDPDGGVGVAYGSSVVGDDVWNALGTNGQFSDFEKLVTGFLRRDAMDSETTLDVVKKAEVFTRLFDGDNV